jgi:hypothetical protein
MSMLLSTMMPCFAAAVHLKGRGKSIVPTGGVFLGEQLLPTDSIGPSTVTFLGVNAGCEIRVYSPDGTELAGIETCLANQVLSWPVYTSGSPDNTVTIRIVGTAYKLKEFNYVTQPGVVSLPIQQEPDKWYYNPL